MVGPGLLWQTPLVAAVPYSSPFNCLLTASSSPLPASVLWTLSSVTKPLPTPQLHISGWRNQVLARTLCAGLSPFCPSQRVVVLSSDPVILLFCPAWSSHQWGGFPGCKLFFFFSSLPGAQVLSHFLFFFPFCPTQFCGNFLVLSGIWGLLLVFCRCSGRTVPFVDYFWCICRREVASVSFSTILIKAPPESDSLRGQSHLKILNCFW